MNFKKFLFGALSALALTACSNEDAPAAPDAGKEGDTYATITLQLPTGSRSSTLDDPSENTNSSSGFEIGQNFENTITTLTIILANKDDNDVYTVAAVSSAKEDLKYDKNNDIYTVLFDGKDLNTIAGKTVYLFAFCNSKYNHENLTVGKNLNEIIGEITETDNIWTKNNFLMTNASRTIEDTNIRPCQIPDEATLHTYNTEDNAFDLGKVRVSRVAARFDFKRKNEDNLYPVVDVNTKELIANVKLLEMAPINIAKDFYYLPRVSKYGDNNNWVLCGQENNSNWVVSPYFGLKNQSATNNIPDELYNKYLYQTPGNGTTPNYSYSDAHFNYTVIDDIFKENGGFENDDDQNWEMPDGDEASKSGFRIWRYVTENTLTATASQKKGISTGIIFKAEILTATDAKESNLSKAINAGEVVYGYNGTFYGNVEALREAADNQTQESKFRVKFEKVFPGALDKIEVDGKLVFKNEITDCTAEANYIEEDGASAFKILRPTTETDKTKHYYVYYLYRNRHNDNSNNSVMRTMEFATVRNNVYKLYVDKISNFGHTDNPKDDPDPEDPDDPDEDDKVYFKVSCYVVPWMVRVNSIEF